MPFYLSQLRGGGRILVSKRLLCSAVLVLIFHADPRAAVAESVGEESSEPQLKQSENVSPGSSTSGSKPASAQYLTIVVGGDLGLGGSGQSVNPMGARKHGRLHKWKNLTAGIAPLINGDINFANLETVVTDSNRLRTKAKAFNFRSHPIGVRHLVKIGFNVFSLSNNHAIDYGTEGMRDTQRHIAELKALGLLAAPGLGTTRRTAGGPQKIQLGKATVLVSALGIGGVRPSGRSPGIVNHRSKQGFRDALNWLAAEKGDYRVLSVHHGNEFEIRPLNATVKKFRDQAVRQAGIDLIVGHHAHVAAGVQDVGGKLVFYGLGNLLHPGMRNMSSFNQCRDFGILAKLYLSRDQQGKVRAGAIELRVLQDMHLVSRPMSVKKARQRIAILNLLATGLDHRPSGAKGVRFRSRADGAGLACLPGAAALGGPIAVLCREWSGLPAESVAATRSCRSRVVEARSQRRNHNRKSAAEQSAGKSESRSVHKQIFGD